MTAPAMYSSGAPGTMQPRRPRTPASPGGDGGYGPNGALQMPPGAGQNGTNQQPGQPGQAQRPRFQTSHPPAAQNGGSAPPPTFAQMQASGQARPAPPPQQQPQQPNSQFSQAPSSPGGASVSGQPTGQPNGQPATQQSVNSNFLSSVNQALTNPSAYGSPQVQDTFNMLKQSLGQDYDYQRKQLNDELASRGLSESTIAGQRYSDLGTEQARAEANMATQLANQAALTYGQDRSSALSAGLGAGNLGVSQSAQSLAQQLGLGNLGVAQQTANTGATSVANQYALGQGQLGLGQQGQDLARQLGLGNLGVSQGQLSLAQQLGLGNLDLSQQQFGLDKTKNQQQYGLQQADVTGSYNGAPTLAAQAQNSQQSQFAQQLAQQLGLGIMSDKTANRNVDLQAQIQNNDMLYRILATVPGLSGLASLLPPNPNGTGSTGSTGGTGGSGGSPSNPSNPTNPNPPAPPDPNDPTHKTPINDGATTGYQPVTRPTIGQTGSTGTPGIEGGGYTGYQSNSGVGDAAPQTPGGNVAGNGNTYGLSPLLAQLFGITTSTGDTPLVGSQNVQPGQTQQQAATQYQQGAYNAFQGAMNGGTVALNTPGLSDQQFNQLIGQRYNSLLNANNGWSQGALQALLHGTTGDVNPNDPRVQSFIQSVGH